MKKNIKKILGVFLSVLLVIVPIISTNVEKVEAEDIEKSCKEFTNYYFFLYVVDISSFDGATFPVTKTHTSYFKTELPENINVETQKLKWIDLRNADEGWTLDKYWDYMEKLGALDNEGNIIKEGNNWYYSHVKAWSLEGGEEKETYTNPFNYSRTENIASTFPTETVSGTNNALNLKNTGNATMAGSIKRTITNNWTEFAAKQDDRYSGGKHPTERHMWLPGLLKVTYEAECEEIAPEFKLTINYLEDGTNKELQNPKDGGTYAEGDTYNKTCDASITTTDGTYTLTSNKNLTGTMPANDKDEYCYYKLNEDEPILPPEEPEEPTEDPTYKVTVNYIDEKTRQPLQDPKVTTGFKNGESYLEDCPDSLLNKTYIYDSFSGNLSGKIAGKDEVIYCIYTNENNKTSDIPIYIVWVVGGAALAYSIYYFRKYYKQENNA